MNKSDISDLINDGRKIQVINCVRKHGPISRTEIYNKNLISKPAISRIIDEFIKNGLVIETGTLEADSKRKPIGIELNANIFYCIGINVSKNTLRVILANFKMEIIYKSRQEIEKIDDSKYLLVVCNI